MLFTFKVGPFRKRDFSLPRTCFRIVDTRFIEFFVVTCAASQREFLMHEVQTFPMGKRLCDFHAVVL